MSLLNNSSQNTSNAMPTKCNSHKESVLQNKLKAYLNPTTNWIRWFDKYGEILNRFFIWLPDLITNFIATLAMITFGATLKGDWLVILVHTTKQYSLCTIDDDFCTSNGAENLNRTSLTLENLKMNNFSHFFIGSVIVSYVIYFSIGGFLHWYFYVQRRHRASEWKIQPEKWLPPQLELHEIKTGCVALLFSGTYSALLACYIANGNPSKVYYGYDEHGWWWFFLQIPLIFIYQDYTTYILHRMYHTPYLYKKFHKLHHTYKQPTAFSVTAIHPVEILHVQLTMCLPLFLCPVHWMPFYAVALYNYYHGIIDHSGINFKAQWWQPWQPDADFHDKHHQYFHVNFGFNMALWDRLHGTTIKKNRVYNETTFHISSEAQQKNAENTPEIKKSVDKGQNENICNGHIKEFKNGPTKIE